MFVLLVALVAFVQSQTTTQPPRPNLAHWVLQYNGTCIKQSSTLTTCQGKAQSQEASAAVDPENGVDWLITQEAVGPISIIQENITYSDNGDFVADGYMTFQVPGQPPQTELFYKYTQTEIESSTSPDGSHFISSGTFDITSGSGVYSDVAGFVTVNTYGRINTGATESYWLATAEANLALAPQSNKNMQSMFKQLKNKMQRRKRIIR